MSRRALTALGVLAIAAAGAMWSGCGDDENEVGDAADQLQEEGNEAIDAAQDELEGADLDEAIDKAQEEADQAQQDLQEAQEEVQDAVDEGDVDAAIEEARDEAAEAIEDAQQRSREAQEELEQAIEESQN